MQFTIFELLITSSRVYKYICIDFKFLHLKKNRSNYLLLLTINEVKQYNCNISLIKLVNVINYRIYKRVLIIF
jgi:hypothetical protein